MRAQRKLKKGTEDGNLKSPIMQDSSTQTDDSFIPTKNSATQKQDSSFQIKEGVDPNYNNFHDSIFKDESNDHETIATQDSSLKLSLNDLIRRFKKR